MWQRFTEHARRVVFFAQEEAGLLGVNEVTPDHILLGILRDKDTVASRLFELLGVSTARIRHMLERELPRGEVQLGKDMQLSAGGKRVIDLAYEEARKLNHTYIGAEHILLGVLREGESLANRVLDRLGVDLDRVTQTLQTLPEGQPAEATEERPEPSFSGLGKETMRLILAADKKRRQLGHEKVTGEHFARVLIQEDRALLLRLLKEIEEV